MCYLHLYIIYLLEFHLNNTIWQPASCFDLQHKWVMIKYIVKLIYYIIDNIVLYSNV